MTNIQKIAAYIDSSPNKERLMAALPVLLELWFSMNKADDAANEHKEDEQG